MENTADEFIEWALHPDRTLEERYGIEVLLEKAEPHCLKKEGLPPVFNYEADRLRNKARYLDPAYQPVLKRSRVERVAGVLEKITHLPLGNHQDRPIRDIAFLRFCPSLTNLTSSQTEVTDWSPISSLPSLKSLSISDAKARDFRPLAILANLETLCLSPGAPWPDLRGFENLAKLTSLHFNGNLLALQAVPHLHALKHATFKHSHNYSVPLRSMADLPEMPGLRTLDLDDTDSLLGIERHPHLLNLTIYGYYTDLTPLSNLSDLTHLFLSGEDFTDLTPVSRIPSLCRFTIRTSLPPDLTPLADSPRLHEILIENTPVTPAELASLNSLAPPWAEEFAAAEKRPLKPLRLLIRKPLTPGEKRLPKPLPPGVLTRDNGDDREMGKSEYRWFGRTIHRRLRRLLGKTWTTNESNYVSAPGCFVSVSVTKPEHIDRLPQIVTAIRKTIASSRYRWTVLLAIDTLAEYGRDIDDITGKDPDAFDAESERQEWEDYIRRKKEREDFLRRKYLHQLSLETGNPQPSPPPGETPPATAPPAAKDISYDKNQNLTFDLGTELNLHATISETAFYVHDTDRSLAETLLETKAEPGEWEDEAF